MEMTGMITHAKRYDFIDQKNGRQVRGCKLTVFSLSENSYIDDSSQFGINMSVLTGAFELFDQLVSLPNYYRILLGLKADGWGKPDIFPVELVPLEYHEVEPYLLYDKIFQCINSFPKVVL